MSTRRKKSMAAPFNAVDLETITKATPYLRRIIQDAQLRENVKTAYDSSRSAYSRLTNGKAPTKALLEDKKLHHDLHVAVEALRDATTALTEAPKKRSQEEPRVRSQAPDPVPWFRARARRQREAPHQGARHGVRQGGGVPVHAAGQRAVDPSELAGRSRLAGRESISTPWIGGATGASGALRGGTGATRGWTRIGPSWRRQPNQASRRLASWPATRRRGSSRRCARASPRAASPARRSTTSRTRPASHAGCCTTTSAPRSGC